MLLESVRVLVLLRSGLSRFPRFVPPSCAPLRSAFPSASGLHTLGGARSARSRPLLAVAVGCYSRVFSGALCRSALASSRLIPTAPLRFALRTRLAVSALRPSSLSSLRSGALVPSAGASLPSV